MAGRSVTNFMKLIEPDPEYSCVMIKPTTPEVELKSETYSIEFPGDGIIQAAIDTFKEMAADGSMSEERADEMIRRTIAYSCKLYGGEAKIL